MMDALLSLFWAVGGSSYAGRLSQVFLGELFKEKLIADVCIARCSISTGPFRTWLFLFLRVPTVLLGHGLVCLVLIRHRNLAAMWLSY